MTYWRSNETILCMILKNIQKAELLIFFSQQFNILEIGTKTIDFPFTHT